MTQPIKSPSRQYAILYGKKLDDGVITVRGRSARSRTPGIEKESRNVRSHSFVCILRKKTRGEKIVGEQKSISTAPEFDPVKCRIVSRSHVTFWKYINTRTDTNTQTRTNMTTATLWELYQITVGNACVEQKIHSRTKRCCNRFKRFPDDPINLLFG